MIYNTRNQSNDTTESQKEKSQCSFSVQPVKNHGTKITCIHLNTVCVNMEKSFN